MYVILMRSLYYTDIIRILYAFYAFCPLSRQFLPTWAFSKIVRYGFYFLYLTKNFLKDFFALMTFYILQNSKSIIIDLYLTKNFLKFSDFLET